MLVAGLFIVFALVKFVEAGSWSLAVQAFQQDARNKSNTPGLLSDVFGREVTPTSWYYQGSHVFWIPKKGCVSHGPYNKSCKSGIGVYDPKESATAEATNKVFGIGYAYDTRPTTSGHYFRDIVTFGGLSRFKEPITFGVAEETGDDRGILGLPCTVDQREPGSSVMHEAWRQGILDAPVFTIYLRHCPPSEDCKHHGMISFGAEDKKNCDPIEGRVKVDPNTIHWQFRFNRLRVGAVDINGSFKTITDTGSPAIHAPPRIYRQMMKQLNAKREKGIDMFDCNIDASIRLTINRHEYIIPSRYMLKTLHNGYCRMELDVYSSPDEEWILGVPFYKAYCNIHNIESRTISFAKVRE